MKFDVIVSDADIERLSSTRPEDWFTSIEFANAKSPEHPYGIQRLNDNNSMKESVIGQWVQEVCPNADVLDAFCANGAFSFMAAQAGAKSVHGFDFEKGRLDAARMTAEILSSGGVTTPIDFQQLDAYESPSQYAEGQFDVAMVLGGLYHVADPPHILRQIRALTKEWLIVQTTAVLPVPGRWARFTVREDRTADGLSSIRGGSGTWKYSASCFKEILLHGGFEVVKESQPSLLSRRRYPWYSALARCV